MVSCSKLTWIIGALACAMFSPVNGQGNSANLAGVINELQAGVMMGFLIIAEEIRNLHTSIDRVEKNVERVTNDLSTRIDKVEKNLSTHINTEIGVMSRKVEGLNNNLDRITEKVNNNLESFTKEL